ncbi:MAG: glycosyltransferase family 4 protein [Patescibacteria group bacterium]|nr:glycosyltransferase family 4 protein [Patescibacteria group bacterium]
MGYAAYKEATFFADFGNSVTVVHCYSNPEIAEFYDSRIKTIYLPIMKIPLIGFFVYYFKLKRFIKEKFRLQEFDLIYIQSLEFGLIDMKKIKIPIFYFARSTMIGLRKTLREEGIKKSFFNNIIHFILVYLEKRCMQYAKLIFVKSSVMAMEVRSLYHINSEKIVTITGGIDKENFKIDNAIANDNLKKRLSIPLSAKIVLYAGRIVPQKGLIYLVNAALQLLGNYDFIVVIAGSLEDKNYWRSINTLLENNIHKKSFYFLGHVNQMDMSSVFNIADCVVTPSLYEPFGMVNLQAAFLGKTVVTTDVTGSIDVLRDYDGLTVICPGSIEAIKDSLEKILVINENKNVKFVDFNQYLWNNVSRKILEHFNKFIIS